MWWNTIGLTWKWLIICFYFHILFLLVTKHFKYWSHFFDMGWYFLRTNKKPIWGIIIRPMILQIFQVLDCGARACCWRPLRGIKFFLSFICRPIWNILVNVFYSVQVVFLSLVETFVYLTHYSQMCVTSY